jgi:hypothetical protein
MLSIEVKNMPLTPEQVTYLEEKQSSYGCGAHDCTDCYPIQYGCEYCTEDFPAPIANGEVYTCLECDWVNNGDNGS